MKIIIGSKRGNRTWLKNALTSPDESQQYMWIDVRDTALLVTQFM